LEDHLASVNDFRWLKDFLSKQDSLAYYQEFNFGHISFLLPADLKVYQDIVTLVKSYNPEGNPSTTTTEVNNVVQNKDN
jgi:hypothetical protein